jgi:hypothetical protein
LHQIHISVNEALAKVKGSFSAMYEDDIKDAHPGIAPEIRRSRLQRAGTRT